jgi:hypothetical protein
MKKLISAMLLVFAAILSFHCQKGISYDLPGNPGTGGGTTSVTATVQGNVTDETGQPAGGVLIKAGNKTATTDAKGYFRIVKASLTKTAVVTAEKTGYFRAYRSFTASTAANHVEIKLVKRSLAGTIAATGGEVTLSGGAIVSLPANSVVKAAGGSYSGPVNVYAAYIDPTSSDIGQRVPGSFMADDASGKRVLLSSYGMMAVELESPAGEKLQVASGNTSTLTMPIPASLRSSAPATIPLWYVDEQTGIWKEEGVATKTGTNYVGQVKHFSFWNCDVPMNAINLSMTLRNNEGGPFVHVQVRLTRSGTGGQGQAYGFTDSVGTVSGMVPSNESILMEVLDPCGSTIYSQNIGPFAQSTNMGVITLTNIPSSSMLTVTGKIVNCTGADVTNGYAVISFGTSNRYVNVNNAGQFSVSFARCGSSPVTIDVTGVDNTAQQQGTINGIAVVTPVTNTGNIIACGLSTTEFINYTLDGTNYSIASANQGDSLVAYTMPMNSVPNGTLITGFSIGNNNNLSLRFGHVNLAPGTYGVSTLSVQSFANTTLVTPFNVVVTNFPNVGGFYEGSFTGQFSAGAGPNHTVSGSFRVRRAQ